MSDTDKEVVRAMLQQFDPARELRIDSTRVSPQSLMTGTEPRRRYGKFVLVAAAALVVLVGTAVAVRVGADQAGDRRGDQQQQQTAGFPFGPIVAPMAFQQGSQITLPLKAAAYESQQGQYSHIGVISWNQVFDEEPGGNSTIIRPQERDTWFDAEWVRRIVTKQLPPVFPNEQSRQYYQKHPQAHPTATGAPDANDFGPGELPASRPLLTTDADIDERLAKERDPKDPRGICSLLVDLSSIYLLPIEMRTLLINRLTKTAGAEWIGMTTDRAGRVGIGVKVPTKEMTEILVFEPETGVLLAWDEVDQAGVVQGAMLFLKAERTDHLE
ncbi:hypothetical protein [Dactylosporangium sp. NPDC051541]|uniref:hypothetical protein n=1 Tax=Dactylosporangium sp. NPDC051541 TaxID=3363977 RepID=UPI0037B9DF34